MNFNSCHQFEPMAAEEGKKKPEQGSENSQGPHKWLFDVSSGIEDIGEGAPSR
jgi:hypothetical protein